MRSGSRVLTSLGRWQRLAIAAVAFFGAAIASARALGAPTWLQVAIAACSALAAMVAMFLAVAHARAERADEWSSLLARPPARVADALSDNGMYALGVDTEAPEAVVHFPGAQAHAPYVRRDLDSEVRAALSRAAARPRCHLIVIAGNSKAGKSRTALEAVRDGLRDAWLIVPRDPESLAEIASRGLPHPIGDGCCVVWVDDIEPWARSYGRGLAPATLADFESWRGSVIVVATSGGKGVELAGAAATQFYEITAEVLARAERIFLSTEISVAERARLATLVGEAPALQIAHQGLGEYLIAAPRLVARLETEHASASGPAVVWAAVDLRRAGLLSSVTGAQLEATFRNYLPNDGVLESLDEGLRWALTPLYARTALLSKTDDRYLVHDWVVSHAHDTRRPLHPAVWDHVVDALAATGEEQYRVAVTARMLGSRDRAQRAAMRAEESGHAGGPLIIGMLLNETGDVEGAERAFRRGEQMGSGNAAVNLGAMAFDQDDLDTAEAAFRRAEELLEPQGAANLGAVLLRRGDTDAAERAFRRAAEAGNQLGASNLGSLLMRRGDREQAEAVLRQADDAGGAGASYNLGVLLQQQGRLDEAEQAFRRADARGSAIATSNLGYILRRRGALAEAEAAFRRAAARGHSRAWSHLASLLEDRHELDAAEDAYLRAHAGGDRIASYNLGILRETRGDLLGAEAAYRLADDLAEQVKNLLHDIRTGDSYGHVELACLARAAFNRAFLAEERGDIATVESALLRAVALGHRVAVARHRSLVHSNPTLRNRDWRDEWSITAVIEDEAELDLADRFDGSVGTYERSDSRGSPLGALHLAVLCHAKEQFEEAEAAYRRAENRGESRGAYGLGLLYTAQGKAESAKSAFRRAGDAGDVALFLGSLLEVRSQLRSAEGTYRCAADHGDGASAYLLGKLLERRGDEQAAEDAYREADEAGDARAAFVRGWLLQARDELPEAEAAYRRADERGSDAGASNLGALLYARGDLDGAEAAWRRAVDRGGLDSLSNLGVVLQARGREAEAEEAWRRADAQGHRDGSYNLAVLLHGRGDLDAARAAYARATESSHPDVVRGARAALMNLAEELGADEPERRRPDPT